MSRSGFDAAAAPVLVAAPSWIDINTLTLRAPVAPRTIARSFERRRVFADARKALEAFGQVRMWGVPVTDHDPGSRLQRRARLLEDLLCLHRTARVLARLAPQALSATVLSEAFEAFTVGGVEQALFDALAPHITLRETDVRGDWLYFEPLLLDGASAILEDLPLSLSVWFVMWEHENEAALRLDIAKRGGIGRRIPDFNRAGPLKAREFEALCAREARTAPDADTCDIWRTLPLIARFTVGETGNPFLDADCEDMYMFERLPNDISVRSIRHVLRVASRASDILSRVERVAGLLDARPGLWPRIFAIWRVCCPRRRAA